MRFLTHADMLSFGRMRSLTPGIADPPSKLAAIPWRSPRLSKTDSSAHGVLPQPFKHNVLGWPFSDPLLKVSLGGEAETTMPGNHQHEVS